ncbi:DnaA/Hda family protein [Fulvimarina sp. 2208YS6-2-32]|uniref:DnaA/Hda family protein n=1 Tax=Fulvimarina uroteuthidis TaxID=3098149 RepID=A0ABU5I3A3_9HYPH|nr:DnaA/Hda family protein [Fulvimarina sp. 2208YS6-2-32]MDY8109847.1 DnaA/Hda family protein [Fulvimarina sp. 2208YS6-2-32]
MARQLPLDLPPLESLARDDLIVSHSNAVAAGAIDAWPHWQHNVLLIVGPEGSGKTHLARAWADLADASMLAIGRSGEMTDRDGFRLVIDDIDRTTIPDAELFGPINAARLGQGFVLATSRLAPEAMANRLADLRSRLAAAARVELDPPDDELFEGILAKHFSDHQLFVDPGTLTYLAERIERTGSAARSVVDALNRQALADKSRITKPFVRKVLETNLHRTADPAGKRQT